MSLSLWLGTFIYGIAPSKHSTLCDLQQTLTLRPPTNVTIKLKDHVKVDNLKSVFARTETNVIFQDGNIEFVENDTNKGLAIDYIVNYLGIDLPIVLIAGNAINDVEILDIDCGLTILIEPDETRQTIRSYLLKSDGIVELDNPTELGTYLAGL